MTYLVPSVLDVVTYSFGTGQVNVLDNFKKGKDTASTAKKRTQRSASVKSSPTRT